MGRKGKFETHVQPFLKDIQEWYGFMSEEQIAKRLGISVASFENYKNQHEDLRNALKRGKVELIQNLKSTLKKKAKGFFYTETKKTIRNVDGVETKVIEQFEKYSPPDTGAIHLLLKNLDDEWRNDDRETMDLKREKLDLEKLKIEANDW